MDYHVLLEGICEMGFQLLGCGAEIYRVEDTIRRLAAAYGTEAEVFAIPNCLIVSITTPQGHPITRMCRIPAHGTDIELLEGCNHLCRSLCQQPLPVEEAMALVHALPHKTKGEVFHLDHSFIKSEDMRYYIILHSFFNCCAPFAAENSPVQPIERKRRRWSERQRIYIPCFRRKCRRNVPHRRNPQHRAIPLNFEAINDCCQAEVEEGDIILLRRSKECSDLPNFVQLLLLLSSVN